MYEFILVNFLATLSSATMVVASYIFQKVYIKFFLSNSEASIQREISEA
jgi:hypothetical protein